MQEPVAQKQQTFGDVCCGADRAVYRWSQTIGDLDVVVPVPTEVTSSQLVSVVPSSSHLNVTLLLKTGPQVLINDDLSYKTRVAETLWSLEPQKHLTIHLEKVHERWWESLLAKEPKLNLSEYELTRPLTDCSEEEEMTLQKLWKSQMEKMTTRR